MSFSSLFGATRFPARMPNSSFRCWSLGRLALTAPDFLSSVQAQWSKIAPTIPKILGSFATRRPLAMIKASNSRKWEIAKLKEHPRQAAMFGDVSDEELQRLANDMRAGQRQPVEIVPDGTI